MFYEGSEKKLEISLKAGAKSLKVLPKSFWELLARVAGVRLIQTVSSPLCDSYLFSEASLFVFPQKFLFIGSGRVRLVSVVKEFLNHFSLNDIDAVFYERKNEVYSHFKSSSFYQDADDLSRLMPGQAFRFGEEKGEHIYLFVMDKASTSAKISDSSLEILMHDLEPDVQSVFTQEALKSRKWISESPLFKSYFDSFDLIDFASYPYGYSLNAVRGDKYFSFHVSPEESGSSASFETNFVEGSVDEMLAAVKSLFKPRSYQILAFSPRTPIEIQSINSSTPHTQHQSKDLNNGFVLQYFAVSPVPETAVCEIIDLPRFTARTENKASESFTGDWILEKSEVEVKGYKVKEKLFFDKTGSNGIEVVDTDALGKALFIDDVLLSSEKNEFIFSEMMAHVPLFVHPNPNRVLIIGGADFSVVKEVLAHESVFECTLLEKDEKILDAAKAFSWTENILSDERFITHFDDAVEFVKNCTEQYDVIFVNTHSSLYSRPDMVTTEFYENLKKMLAPGALVVSDAGPLLTPQTEVKKLKASLQNNFNKIYFYTLSSSALQGGMWSLSFASDTFNPLDDFDRSKALKSKINFKYYNAELHYAAFIQPTFLKKLLKEPTEYENTSGQESLGLETEKTT